MALLVGLCVGLLITFVVFAFLLVGIDFVFVVFAVFVGETDEMHHFSDDLQTLTAGHRVGRVGGRSMSITSGRSVPHLAFVDTLAVDSLRIPLSLLFLVLDQSDGNAIALLALNRQLLWATVVRAIVAFVHSDDRLILRRRLRVDLVVLLHQRNHKRHDLRSNSDWTFNSWFTRLQTDRCAKYSTTFITIIQRIWY